MIVYTNISNFMRREGISYSDRVVLQVLLSVIKKGYQIVPFIVEGDYFIKISSQLFAEYFFTKNIAWKNKYKLKEILEDKEICEEDIYFEVDILLDEKISWDEYYSRLQKTNCRMYSYLYFTKLFNKKMEMKDDWVKKQLIHMDKVFAGSKEVEEELCQVSIKNGATIEILSLNLFLDDNCNDELLKTEKGLKQIIQEGNFVVSLLDYDMQRSNRILLEEIEKKYPEKKIVVIAMSSAEIEKLKSYLYKNRKLGKTLFIAVGMDYYTLLNLYLAADMVIIPKNSEKCKFEVMNIENVKGKYLFL